jgi:hypothetical protein
MDGGKGWSSLIEGLPKTQRLLGDCKAGASNHFGEEFNEQKDCRL